MWTVVMAFFKGNAMRFGIGILITALVSGGGWFLNNKYEAAKLEKKHNIEAMAILSTEYVSAVKLAEENAEAFAEYRAKVKLLDEVVYIKHQEDIEREKGIADIREGLYDVDKKDSNVSDVIRSTLDGIRMLRESKDN